ncbi:unnamed protein product [Prunus armeniaca]
MHHESILLPNFDEDIFESPYCKSEKTYLLPVSVGTSVFKGMPSRASARGGRKTPEVVSCFTSCTFSARKVGEGVARRGQTEQGIPYLKTSEPEEI